MTESNLPATVLLDRLTRGNAVAANQLLPLIYEELRSLAASRLRQERANHTLQPTALVHEAYLKLIDQNRVNWQSKAHFMAVAAEMIRRILIDHARAHNADKRGGNTERVALSDSVTESAGRPLALLDLDAALTELAALNHRQAKVVELRYFAGLDVASAAEVLGVSERTVKNDWRFARAWLRDRLADESERV